MFMVHKRSWVDKKLWVQLNFKSEKILGLEKIWGRKELGSNKFLVWKLFCLKNIFGLKKSFWSKKQSLAKTIPKKLTVDFLIIAQMGVSYREGDWTKEAGGENWYKTAKIWQPCAETTTVFPDHTGKQRSSRPPNEEDDCTSQNTDTYRCSMSNGKCQCYSAFKLHFG